MSAPVTIPRSTKRLSTSSISSNDSSSSYSSVASSSSSLATSYHSTSTPSSPKTGAKGLYVPVHKRSPSPSVKALPQEPSPALAQTSTSRTYTIPYLLSLRSLAHEGMKDKLRAGPAPELVMNRKMRKNLEFAESHHRRVSPTSSAGVSPLIETAKLPLAASSPSVVSAPAVQAPVIVTPAPAPAPASSRTAVQPETTTKTKRIPSRSRTPFSSRAPSERRRQALAIGGMHAGGLNLNVASWRNAVPVGVAPSVAFV